MTSSPRLHNALALLLASGLLVASSAGCETAPPASATTPSPQASASAVTVADAAATADDPAAAAPAANKVNKAIVIGERQTFHSTILGEDRTLLIYTPPSYEHGKDTYPVLYLLDGEDHFQHTIGITSFQSNNQRVPEMIVVGVANNGNSRVRDFTPTAQGDMPGSGGSDKFLSFLKDELRPRIEGSYRTAPYRILVGHSLGGLFAVQTLTSAPDAFNAYVAISPSLWWEHQRTLRQAETFFAAHAGLQSFLYFTIGNEREEMRKDAGSLAALLKSKAPRELRWEFKSMPVESHGTTPHRSTYDGLEALFAGWEPPAEIETVKALEAHYEALSKRLHFEVKVSEGVLNNFGYKRLEKHLDVAIAAFQLNVQRHPDSANVYDSLGEALEKNGQLDLAKANYEIAVRKATETSDPVLPALKANLERLSKSTTK